MQQQRHRELVEALAAVGLRATLEYPGTVQIPLDGWVWVGDIEGTLLGDRWCFQRQALDLSEHYETFYVDLGPAGDVAAQVAAKVREQDPVVVLTKPERRQVSRVLAFPPELTRHINWDSIAEDARQLGAHFEARTAASGACTVTLFWTYDAPVTSVESQTYIDEGPQGLAQLRTESSLATFVEQHPNTDAHRAGCVACQTTYDALLGRL